MPISDVYVVQCLLQGTLRTSNQIEWSEEEGEQAAFSSLMGGVRVELSRVHTTVGSRLVVCFAHEGHQVSIDEPAFQGFFRGLKATYSNEADQELAGLLRRLAGAVERQCAQRKLYSMEHREEVRERIYRRLLFEHPERDEDAVKGER